MTRGCFIFASATVLAMAAMAGGHVIAKGGVSAVAARSQVGGDPLAPGEDLDRAGGDPGLDLLAGEAEGNAVEVLVDLNMEVDADAPGCV